MTLEQVASTAPSDHHSLVTAARPVSVSATARRFEPFFGAGMPRIITGLLLLVLALLQDTRVREAGTSIPTILPMVLGWILSVWVTHKYVHKYPQRYLPYLAASHLRAIGVLAVSAGVFALALDARGFSALVPWRALLLFSFIDFLVALPKRPTHDLGVDPDRLMAEFKADGAIPFATLQAIDRDAISTVLSENRVTVEVRDFVESHLPGDSNGRRDVAVLGDITSIASGTNSRVALIVAEPRMNDVCHLDAYLAYCAAHVVEGGYVVMRYRPLENVLSVMRSRYSGLRYWLAYVCHFLWYRAVPKIPKLATVYFHPWLALDRAYVSLAGRRNRAIARAEMWGRLAFWGLDVVSESAGETDIVLLARAVRSPVRNRVPSYFAIVALEKIGLDGQPLRLHKVRTMFPFSEFLQKRVFEQNGLSPSGKFANDFRLTEFGRTLRRYWIDEIPQVWDWLRGDIKLVGIRATSRHFLTLYPRDFIELYVQIKPGLVPPVFGPSVTTLDQIIEVEQRYQERYLRSPFLTDLQYFAQTLRDIALRGVRSK